MPYSAHPYILSDCKNWINLILWLLYITSPALALSMPPVPWSDTARRIKHQLESKTNERFNSVLINYYRDGQDCNGWHSDDELELDPNPIIASLSLGDSRDLKLRHKTNKNLSHTFSL